MEAIIWTTSIISRSSGAALVFFDKVLGRLVGKILYAVFAGVVGTVLMVLFFSTFLHVPEFTLFSPLIIAFNTAMTGYALIEKTRNHFSHKKMASMLAGAVSVILAHSILNVFFWIQSNAFIYNRTDLIFFILVGLICGGLGGILAVRYFQLGKPSGNRSS